MVSTEEERLAREAIQADAQFVSSVDPDKASIAGMSIAPFYSLFIYEARSALVELGDNPRLLPADAERQLAKSRHTVKLFEDTKRYIEGQVAHMRDTLIPAHRDAFLNKTWLPIARWLESDLGIWALDRQLFTTTHTVFFSMGAPDELMKDLPRLGIYARQMGWVYGREFRQLAGTTQPSCNAWLLADKRLDRARDRRSEKVYAACFNGSTTSDLNAMLTAHLALVRTARDGFGCSHPSGECYTRFKIRYLALFQVYDSLSRLERDPNYALTPISAHRLRSIANSNAPRLTSGRPARSLRNTLVHYIPRVKPSVQLTGRLLDDLLLASGFTEHLTDVEASVDIELDRITNELLQWCGRPW
ncbi:MAG: hypothetical protein QM650_10620 [Microlunatus sp.]